MSEPTRILVVDDSIDIRELFEFVLEGAGYQVSLAADGEEGLDQARTFRPDLIVTDVSMPRMSEFDLLVRLRSDLPPPLPPVIVCSGFDVTADEALRLGAVRFVAKPIEPSTLLRIVEQTLRGQVGDQTSLEQEREFVRGARARAAAAAARLLAGINLKNPELVRALTGFVQWVADYFGYCEAGLVLVHEDGLIAAAVSRGALVPAGATFSGRGLYSTGVLASGTSLVLSDAAGAMPFLGDPRLVGLGIDFLVGVPLLFHEVPVGALCLFDTKPHAFNAEDLLIVEAIGRTGAAGLPKALQNLGEQKPTGERVGLVPPAAFDAMLGAELSLLYRERGGLDLVFIQVDPGSLQPGWASRFSHRSRLGVSVRTPGTLAIFKRDRSASGASAVIADVLASLRTATTVQAVGWISLADDGQTRVPAQVMLELAAAALEQARSTPDHPVERIVLRQEGWPTDRRLA